MLRATLSLVMNFRNAEVQALEMRRNCFYLQRHRGLSTASGEQLRTCCSADGAREAT